MPDPTEGGLYVRLVMESFHRWVRHYFFHADLHWDDTDGLAKTGTKPVTLTAEPVPAADKVQPNLVTLTLGPNDEGPAELGSDLAFEDREVWGTIYAQNQAVGLHIQGDLHDIWAGKLRSIDADTAGFPVYDWRHVAGTIENPDLTYPPVDKDTSDPLEPIGYIELEDIHTDREIDPATGVERNTFYVIARMADTR